MKRLYSETEEIHITRKKEWIYIDEEFTQVYNSLFSAFVKSKSVVETQLLLYLFGSVSESGMFDINKEVLYNFNASMKAEGGKSISEVTFYKCLKNLVDNKIIAKLDKGTYHLNPKYLWKGRKEEREEILRDIIKLPEHEKQKYLE